MAFIWLFPIVKGGLGHGFFNTCINSLAALKDCSIVETPVMIGKSQMNAIYKLAKLFNNIQLQQINKPNTDVVPIEMPLIEPPKFPITLPPPRVPMKMASPRVMAPRIPFIAEENNVEETDHVEAVENNKFQQQCYH